MISEKQYLELCKACDGVLLASNSTFERVSITWLHIIREHPVFLSKYKDIFDETSHLVFKVNTLFRSIYHKIGWLKFIIELNLKNKKKWYSTKKESGQLDFLFVSHILNENGFGREDDFYFSNLPHKLQSEGMNVAIACFNHTKFASEEISKKWNGDSIERIILSNSTSYRDEAKIRNKLKVESEILRKQACREKQGISKRIYNCASIEALSSSARKNLRTVNQLENIIQKYQPKVLVVTFEGHAWERLAFAIAHKINTKIRRVGFQHSAIFRLQHAIKRSLKNNYDPDYVLTSGAIGKRSLNNNNFKNTPIEILGTNRGFSSKTINVKNSFNSSCLVLPEGDFSECNLLFEFSLKCAKVKPEIYFLWRLHPLISFSKLIRQNKKFNKLPPNIILSERSLDEDIERCRFVLYRGTTAVLRAIGGGLVPIYLELKGEMSINPIYEINELIPKVSNPNDFHIQVSKTKSSEQLKEIQMIIEYCQNFYSPLDHHKLLDIYYEKN